MVYTWREGYPMAWALDAQQVGEYLDAVQRANDGLITPEAVIEDSQKNKNSPLRDYFEWDDTEAAKRYRVSQAQRVIGAVVTVAPEVTSDQRQLRAFVNVVKGDGNYRPIRQVLDDDQLRHHMLQRAIHDLERLQARYDELEELRDLFEMIDTLRSQIARPKGSSRGTSKSR